MFFHQFWKVRSVLNFSEPEFSKTVLGKGKRPKIDVVKAIFPKCRFFLRHPVLGDGICFRHQVHNFEYRILDLRGF